MFSEVGCGGVEDGKRSEVSMKTFAMKTSMSEMVSLGGKGDERMGKILVIKEELESAEGFAGEAQERRLVLSTQV